MARPTAEHPSIDGEDFLWAGLLACSSAALYLSFLTKFYVFEGLARAMPIEAGRFSEVFKGNYLAYGFLGWCFHGLLKALGMAPLAVVSLQIMDCLLGGAGLFLFFLSLRRLGAQRLSAAAWASALGLSLAYWSWATDAQNYIFSTFVLGVNFFFLVRYATGRTLSPAALGALHVLAVLGHIVNLIFGAAIIYFLIAVNGKNWRKPVAAYAATAVLGVLAAYAFILGLIVRPPNGAAAWHWFFGSLVTGKGGLGWHGAYSLSGLKLWCRMTLNILVSYAPGFDHALGWPFSNLFLASARILLALLVLRLAFRARRLTGPRRTVAVGCGVWLLAYAAVFTSWEPQTMVYRVSDLLPIMTLLFLGVEAAPQARALWRAAPGLLIVFLGLGNFAAEVYPHSIRENNYRLIRMDEIKAHTDPEAWIAAAESDGGGDELYIPFFTERRPIVLGSYRNRPADLTRLLTGLLQARQKVYISSRVLSDEFWKEYFRPYHLRMEWQDEKGFALYRLAKKA